MAVFLVLFALGFVYLGYLVMRRIDRFIDGGGVIDSPRGRAERRSGQREGGTEVSLFFAR